MATINWAREIVPPRADQVHVYTWAAMANGDTGQAVELPWYADRTVQVIGTYGASGKARIEGSLNGTDWATLSDPQGADLDISSVSQSIATVTELTRYIRPSVPTGDGSTELTIMILVRQTS